MFTLFVCCPEVLGLIISLYQADLDYLDYEHNGDEDC